MTAARETPEVVVLAPLAVLCVVLGVRPGIVTDAIEPSLESILTRYPALVEAGPALAVVEDGQGAARSEDGRDG